MKKIVYILAIVLGISQGVWMEEIKGESPIVSEEISFEHFVNEFFTALQANDTERIQQLVTANPNTAKQVHQDLIRLGESTEEDADISRFLAEALEKFLPDDVTEITQEISLKQLFQEGIQAYHTSDYQAALKKWEQGLKQACALYNTQYISQFLGNIGNVYATLEQYQQAIKYYKQALIIHRELGDRYGEEADLSNIGIVYENLRQYQQALEYYQQALAINRELGDKRRESINLNALSNLYESLGQYQQALEYYQLALTIVRELRNKRGESDVLNNIGNVYESLGQYQRALEYYEQALTIYREISDRSGEGTVLGNIGNVYENLGQYQRALEYYKESLIIKRETGNRQGEGITLVNLGWVYDELGQYQRALEYYEQALIIHQETAYRLGEGTTLSNIGVVYYHLGQYQKALEYYEQALTIHRQIGDQRGEGIDLTNIGAVYQELGQYQQALVYHKQALIIRRQIGDREGEGNDLANLGSVYLSLGQYQQALVYYKEALAIFREINHRMGEGTVLNLIGLVYENPGQYQQALDYHNQALVILREIGHRNGEGRVLGNLGNVYWFLGQLDLALEYQKQALTITRELGDRLGEGTILSNIGGVYNHRGQYQQASIVLQDSISIHQKLGTLDVLWRPQRWLAWAKAKLNQPESALMYYEQALENIEKLRAGVPEKEYRLSFIRDKLFVYDELIDLLQDLHQKHSDKGYDRKALEIFERKQGRVFLEEMGKSGARLFAIPAGIPQRELDLENQLEQVRRQLADERSKLITEQNKEQIKNLEEWEKTLITNQQNLQEQIRTGYPDYYALKYPKPVTLADLQQKVLQSGELLLAYGVMKEKTCLWVVGKEEFGLYLLDIGEKTLQEKVAKLRRSMELEWKRSRGEIVDLSGDEDKQLTFVQLSHELYTTLIPEAIRPLLNEQHTLHVVPSGPLYALPFEALVTREPTPNPSQADSGLTGNVHYLIEDIPISYLSSASLLKTLREAKARRKEMAPYPLLAFAHPVYQESPTPNPSHQGRRTVLPTPNPSQEGNWGTSLQALRSQAYQEFMRGYFEELPETAEEVEAIKTLLNAPEESDPLQLRERASRASVFVFNVMKRLVDYQYLIFATHGVLPGEVDYIKQPALVLSFPDNDGYLTMADVFGLQLNAKLVVLSACNTGSGEQIRGEGVMGLTRAFMYAGTSAIAVTLWSVETYSAKELDVGFFCYLNGGKPSTIKDEKTFPCTEGNNIKSPVQALRAIKLDMLHGKIQGRKGELYHHPYYWAPFVLFGDGK